MSHNRQCCPDSVSRPPFKKQDALDILLAHAHSVVGSETIPTGQGLGRVLAAPVIGMIDVPAWDNSAMDGYAVRCADVALLPTRLRVTQRRPGDGSGHAGRDHGCLGPRSGGCGPDLGQRRGFGGGGGPCETSRRAARHPRAVEHRHPSGQWKFRRGAPSPAGTPWITPCFLGSYREIATARSPFPWLAGLPRFRSKRARGGRGRTCALATNRLDR